MGYLSPPGERLALTHASVLDLAEGRWLDDRVVHIASGRIESVVAAGEVERGVRVVDCTGKYVIPGLIDTHIHWEGWMGEILLVNGTTTALDPGSMFPLHWMQAQKEGLADGRILGPRLLIAGAMFHGAATEEQGRGLFADWHPLITGPGQAAKAAARLVEEEGVDCLKAYNFLTLDAIEELATVAREAGIPSMGHISVSGVDAARRGLRGLAHATGMIESTVPRSILDRADQLALQTIKTTRPPYFAWFDQADDDLVDKALDVLIECGTFLEPDMIHTGGRGGGPRVLEYEVEDSAFLQNPAVGYIPEAVRAEILGYRRIGEWEQAGPEELGAAQRGLMRLWGILAEFHRRGGKLLAASGLGHVIPGLSIHRELQLMVDIGLSPLDALRGATSVAAEFLGQSDDVGSVVPGQRADLVVLDGDPLRDIRHTRSIAHVVQHGRLVDVEYHAWYQNPIPEPPQEFTFARSRPRIDVLTPPALPAGSAAVLEVTGDWFAPHSVVELNGLRVPTEFVSRRELRARIEPRSVPVPGLYDVRVRRPQPVEHGDLSEPGHLVVSFGPPADDTRKVDGK
ncbi:amidohydrolase family protein [Saccharomonospora sp. NPDC046836]|uniref:amidohydrolase family protein n=1 Tax=Saccharomonospora sp. NPDC046836 TaxID=3156921 RepID=UPI0033CB3B68